MTEQNVKTVVENISVNPDSIEWGTPSKGGAIKVYGDFSNEDAFNKKVEAAKRVATLTQTTFTGAP